MLNVHDISSQPGRSGIHQSKLFFSKSSCFSPHILNVPLQWDTPFSVSTLLLLHFSKTSFSFLQSTSSFMHHPNLFLLQFTRFLTSLTLPPDFFDFLSLTLLFSVSIFPAFLFLDPVLQSHTGTGKYLCLRV